MNIEAIALTGPRDLSSVGEPSSLGLRKRSLSLDVGADSGEDDTSNDVISSGEPLVRVSDKSIKKKKKNNALSQSSTTDTVSVVDISNGVNYGDVSSREICVFCAFDTCTNLNSVQCDICEHYYHLRCCGVTEDYIAGSLAIASFAGWTCRPCRSDMKSIIRQLRSEVDSLRAVIVVNAAEHSTRVMSSQPNPIISSGSVGHSPQFVGINDTDIRHIGITSSYSRSTATVESIVRRTLTDATRRKRNIIVSGLPESTTVDDDARSFLALCEEQLQQKPFVEANGIRRLGTSSSAQRPRRLLVRLRTEQAADELLSAARDLRRSANTYIAQNVFFNKDLTKEEAKLAFESRVRRRAAARNESNVAVGSSDQLQDLATTRPNLSQKQSRVFYRSANSYDPPTFNPSNLIVCASVSGEGGYSASSRSDQNQDIHVTSP